MRISDWSSDVCASDRAEEGRDVGAEIVDGIAAFHDDQRRQSRVGDFPADHRIILRLQPEEGNRVAAERVGAEGQDQQFRREDADAVYRLVERREDRKSTRLNSSHYCATRLPSSACTKKQITPTNTTTNQLKIYSTT